MTPTDYILTSDELVQQIHRVVKDIYPTLSFSGDDVSGYINNISDNKAGLRFNAYEFSKRYNIPPEEFIEKVYIELMVEYEKNWHDRIYFKILKDDRAIYFEAIKK